MKTINKEFIILGHNQERSVCSNMSFYVGRTCMRSAWELWGVGRVNNGRVLFLLMDEECMGSGEPGN